MSRTTRFGFALVVLAFVFSVPAPAEAGSVDNTGPFAMLTGQLQGRGDAEALFLWDKDGQRLAVYLVTPTKMELLFVRNCMFDFEVDVNPGKMSPSPAEIRRLIEEGGDKGEGKEKATKPKKPKKAKGKESPVPQPEETPEEPAEPEAEEEAKPAAPAKSSTPVVRSRPESSEGWTLSLGKLQGGNADALYIMSHRHQRLAVYAIRANTLELLFSRDCSADLEIGRSFGRTTPRVKDIQDEVSKRQKKEEKKGKSNSRSERAGDGAQPRR